MNGAQASGISNAITTPISRDKIYAHLSGILLENMVVSYSLCIPHDLNRPCVPVDTSINSGGSQCQLGEVDECHYDSDASMDEGP